MSTADFYDAMEPFYHLVYPDWQASIDRQGAALFSIIHDHWGASVKSVLDATCGIGTQALGLTARGFDVTASDVSPQSINRLNVEAASRSLKIHASVCDIRQVWRHHARQFDLVISCDNALPHLNPDDELPIALRQMFDCTRIGGGCVVSIRDYAKENLKGLQLKPYGMRKENGRNLIAFQTWECHDRSYEVTMYFVEDGDRTPPKCHSMRSTYYPIDIMRLMALMTDTGFDDVQRLDGVFFQPVIIGKRLR